MTPTSLLEPAAWAALWSPLGNHLWQSTLFAAAAGLLTLALRKNHAQARHWLWLAASFKFLLPFSLLAGIGSALEWRSAPAAAPPWSAAIEQISQPFALPPVSAVAAPALPAGSPTAPALLAAAWFFGCAVVLSMGWARWRRIRAVMRRASPLPIPAPIRVMSSPTRLEPGVFGVFRPVLLLPEGIAARLTPAQLEAILAHELCHVRRRDNLAAAVHMLVEGIFWFHPLVWWIGARMVDERERACDEEVLLLGNEPQAYAEGILNVCKFYLTSPLACASGVTGSDLEKRIEAIMTQRIAQKLTLARKLLLAAAGITAIAGPIIMGIANAPSGRAQSQSGAAAGAPLTFEVASIRPAAPQPGRKVFVGFGNDPGRFTATNVTVKDVLVRAYQVRPHQITGPSWLDGDRYDIVAKVPEGATKDQVPVMVQNLVIERFKLTFRREKKEASVYALVVGNNGPKLEKAVDGESAPGKHEGTMIRDGSAPGMAHVEGTRVTLSRFADMLSRMMDRPVVDQTGLEGSYNFTFEVSSEYLRMKGGPRPLPDTGGSEGPAPDGAPGGPSIFGAIQKLGLKLEGRKVPLDFIIIDKGNRTPTEN